MAVDFGVDVPEHTILGHLGQGGMARVFLARDDAIGRLVAIKVIDARFDTNDQFLKRFEREAKTAGSLSHPSIVPIHRFGQTVDGRPYITMAYLEGGSLRDRLRRQPAMAIDEALNVMRQIAGALQAAHSRQIIHRDLKPDNILFQGESAFLTDFGIAKLLDTNTELTGVGANPGTVRYFSPEQAQDRPLDARSDIYSLGVVLYEMVAGKSPIEADSVPTLMMHIAYTPPEALPASLQGMQPFMDVLLAKEPAGRLGSCTEVIVAIDAMMRNWMRYESLDRLTEGVALTPSGTAAAKLDLDDTINVVVTGSAQVAPGPGRYGDPTPRSASLPERVNPVRPAFAASPRGADLPNTSDSANDTSGLTELGGMFDAPIAAEPPARGGYGRGTATGGVSVGESATTPRRLPMLLGGGVLVVALGIGAWWIVQTPTVDSSRALPAAALRGPDVKAPDISRANAPSVARNPIGASAGEVPVTASAQANSTQAQATPDATRVAKLLARMDGKWTFEKCAAAATFSAKDGRLLQYWPQMGLAEEKVIATDAGSVTTEVITPAAQAGKHFRYSPGAKSMRIEDIAGKRSDTLKRCR